MYKDFTKYEIYDDGKIWSYKKKRFLKPQTNKNGYQQIQLSDNEGKKKMYYLHRVVWEAVTGSQIPQSYEINHINEDKTSNFFANLQLISHKENINFGTGISRRAKTQSKQVGAYKDGELVFTFPSAKEGGRQGFDYSHISECCNGKRKTHKGFEWRYL